MGEETGGSSQRLAVRREPAPPDVPRPGRGATVGWGLVARFGALTFLAVGLFVGYLRMSRSRAVNADGASNALQAWDMLHGNPLLHGWTVSDVSFYPTE